MAAADALFLWAETPTRPLHVGALAVLSQPDNGTGRYLRKVFSAAVARQQVAPWWRRRPHRSLTSLGQWSWRTETEVDLDYHVRLSALPPRAGPPSCGRWFLNYTPACWTAPARYGRWT